MGGAQRLPVPIKLGISAESVTLAGAVLQRLTHFLMMVLTVNDPPRFLDLIGCHLRKPDVADLAFFLEVPEGSEAFLHGHSRVDAMQLI